MNFDPENNIVKLCAQGMELEGAGKKEEAYKLFMRAWEESSGPLEKFIAAHYVARHQKDVKDKLAWDIIALENALTIEDDPIEPNLPSLYLNIARGYEDLEENDQAVFYYQLANSYSDYLSKDGYGKMIRSGINSGLQRMEGKKKNEIHS